MSTVSKTIALSSIFFGSLYMTTFSLKEINKLNLNPKTQLADFILNWTIFIASGVYLLNTTSKMYDIMNT